MSDPLDNPVWHALVGPHARATNDDAYADLASGLPNGIEACLFRPIDEPLPRGWIRLDAFPMLQMIMRRLPEDAPVGPQPIDLSLQDAPSLMELAQIAKPGPFGPRTAELGAYVGVRDGGRLIAMAGARMRVPGYVELSAIEPRCSLPGGRPTRSRAQPDPPGSGRDDRTADPARLGLS